MTTLVIPPLDERPWPTLGPGIVDLIEARLVHGPGDLRGAPAHVDDEKRALIYRAYEVFPHGHAQAGRRRFRRVAWSLRKGTAKTEVAAWLAAVELHPEGPVRCDGWRRQGSVWVPVGAPVTDPYIPMIAYTEEQSDELAFAALFVAISEGPDADLFDIGLDRIMRLGGDGKAVSVAAAPDSRDGSRTTFELADETHRLTLPRQREAWRTMLANLPKRKLADAWALETTTAPTPGEGSVAESTMDYAGQVAKGEIADSRLFFFHRQASDGHDLTTVDGVRAAVLEASGPTAEWSDIDGIVEQWQDPTADRAYLARVWLNRLERGTETAFDMVRWKQLGRPGTLVEPGRLITVGFDGARFFDATALIGTDIETGYQWPLGIWARPPDVDEWEVPADEVDAAVDAAFATWNVWRLYGDPPYWETALAEWAGRYGHERVVAWYTRRPQQMAYAVRGYANAIASGNVTHPGAGTRLGALFTEHVGNCRRRPVPVYDEDRQQMFTVAKEAKNSPFKIDTGVAGILSWQARTDAVTAGAIGAAAAAVSVYAGLTSREIAERMLV